MAERAAPHRLLSAEEYLDFEKDSPIKHGFVGRRVYAMTGVGRPRSRISGNIFRRLADAAEGGSFPLPCPPGAELSLADIYRGLRPRLVELRGVGCGEALRSARFGSRESGGRRTDGVLATRCLAAPGL